MDELLKSRFLALYCMVLADGVIDANELETLYRIGSENYGLTNQQIAEAVKEAGTSFILPDRLEDKVSLLYQMAQICVSDNDVDETELNLLRRYSIKMGFEPDHVDEVVEFMISKAQENTPEKNLISLIVD